MYPNCVFKNEIVLNENRESLIKGKDSKWSQLINHAISLFKVMPSSLQGSFSRGTQPCSIRSIHVKLGGWDNLPNPRYKNKTMIIS